MGSCMSNEQQPQIVIRVRATCPSNCRTASTTVIHRASELEAGELQVIERLTRMNSRRKESEAM